MPTVDKLPEEFVAFLRKPGFRTNAGTVALDTYMNLNKPECKAPLLFDALTATNIADTDSKETAYTASCGKMKMPYEEWKIMRKGQGYYECYVRLWNWLWDNQEQLEKSSNSQLKQIYETYFRFPSSKNAIQQMMHANYFGNECIGFVSNYLRWIGVWEFYKGIANGQWSREFEIPVNKHEDMTALNVVEWADNSHVAIINKVGTSTSPNGDITIEICQCSSGGPQLNESVTLRPTLEVRGGARVYVLSGGTPACPVTGSVFIRKKRDLAFERFRNRTIEIAR
jgi:hypothetical protein